MTELMVGTQQSDTHQKALRINLDPRWYGTIAEIGAGQEVVRWFFRVGGAAGTVAKSISAYDMVVSDAVYGKADRYVSAGRLRVPRLDGREVPGPAARRAEPDRHARADARHRGLRPAGGAGDRRGEPAVRGVLPP